MTKDEIETNVKLINRFSSELLLSAITSKEVEDIVFKLCNMNTEI